MLKIGILARRRHRTRSRARIRQGDEGRRGEDRARGRMAASFRSASSGHERHGHTMPEVTVEALRADRRLDQRADRPQRLSAQRSDVDHAAAAQEVRPLRERQAGEVVSEPAFAAQGRGHRVPARGDRRHAGERHGRRGQRRVPAERRDLDRLARRHAQGREPRRARSVRDRAHAQAQESDRGAQGARLPAGVRHVRRGMPQGGEGISRTSSSRKCSSTASR